MPYPAVRNHVEEEPEQAIKCLVWDLDNTLWDGMLLEDPRWSLRPEVAEIIRALDERGILHSIASRNDHALAMEKLREFGLADYFLWPQINWNPKSDSIKAISENLRLGLDTFAFVDDQPFERAEVAFAHPKVLCIDAADLSGDPRHAADASAVHHRRIEARRLMYLSDERRQEAEQRIHAAPTRNSWRSSTWSSPSPKSDDADLKRAEELTVRTHQLNTTGLHVLVRGAGRAAPFPGPPAADRRPGRRLRLLRQDRPDAGGARPAVWTIKLL